MRVAIIGAGLQCKRRLPVLVESKEVEIKVIVSKTKEHAEIMASTVGCESSNNWKNTVIREDIDVVLVLTPPNSHSEISLMAMRHGKHVLCEKPLARTLPEAEKMVKVANETNRILKCGFNHRHHPAIWEAKKRLDSGDFGQPISARARYGICGRPGYENEWRANPKIAAGGHFMEQGVHVLDLFRWFIGSIDEVCGFTSTKYFQNQPMEDNGMVVMRSKNGALAMLHSSLTQWKNLFSFELLGSDGYFEVQGLGSSYGTEKLIIGKRDFEKPFQDNVILYRGSDKSWHAEWNEFTNAIKDGRKVLGDAKDGLEAMRLALAVFESEQKSKIIKIEEQL